VGFSEFINGMSAADVARMKEWEREQLLRQEHKAQEDYLAVLRPGGDLLPPANERFGIWNRYRVNSCTAACGAGGLWDWWSKNFPESWRIFGAPISWDEPNLDFLASALGELPLGVIYFSEETNFYFRDYAFQGAYRPTSNVKLVALAKKLVMESVQGAPLSLKMPAKPIFHSAERWVERAQSILAVEGHFFNGEEGRCRWIEGRFVNPLKKPSVVLFTEKCVQLAKGGILSAPNAYQLYSEFCKGLGVPSVKKAVFRHEFANEVKKRWKLGLRNDLKMDGKTLQGWRELTAI
jgi:hypothetical protein